MKQKLLFLTFFIALFYSAIGQTILTNKTISENIKSTDVKSRDNIQVTFQVNMANETVSEDGIHVAGSWQGDPTDPSSWDPSVYEMVNDGAGLYSITISLESQMDYYYVFFNGNTWGTQEDVPVLCQDDTYSLRQTTVESSDFEIDPVCFGYCIDCATFRDITFQVDMKYQDVSVDGVYIKGSFTPWNGTQMTNLGGTSIWTIVIPVMEGSEELYRFVNGDPQQGGISENWGVPYPPCTAGEPRQRYLIVPDADETLTVCFEYCAECPNILISEIASPEDNPDGNFIELYNAGPGDIDFSTLPIWVLQYYTYGTAFEMLTGSLSAGEKYIVAPYDFNDIYGFSPDLEASSIYNTGNDAFGVFMGNADSWLTLIDVFGSIDESSGDATLVDYDNSKAVRLRSVTEPSPVYLLEQWHIPYTTAVAEMTPAAHNEDVNWTGSINAYWNEKGNWDGLNGYIPDASFNVNIPQETNQPWIIYRDADCNNLTLQTGADLNVEQSMWVTIYGDLDVSAGNMTIHSDQFGEMGSLITYGNVAGNIHFLRDISDDVWHLVSSPVTSATADVFYDDYVQYYSENLGDWVELTSYLDPINPMQGYALWGVPSRNVYDFYGVPNTGNQSINFAASNSGWNLLGNPYPSAVDWDSVDIPTGMNSAIYYLDASTGSYVSYVNGTPGDQDLQYIPANQGFWVSATGSGTLTFDDNVRTHYPGALYYKKEEIVPDYIKLLAARNSDYDQTFIRFKDDATEEFDGKFDAYKLMAPNQNFPQLFTYAGNDILSVNQLPEAEVIDMGFYCGNSGTFSIILAEMYGIANCLLEDLKTGQTQDLRLSSYSFVYTAGEPEKRFRLHFGPNSITQTPFAESILIYSKGKKVFVSAKNTIHSGTLTVTDLTGRTLIEKNIDNQQAYSFNTGLQRGVYLITLTGQGIVKTEKVLIE